MECKVILLEMEISLNKDKCEKVCVSETFQLDLEVWCS